VFEKASNRKSKVKQKQKQKKQQQTPKANHSHAHTTFTHTRKTRKNNNHTPYVRTPQTPQQHCKKQTNKQQHTQTKPLRISVCQQRGGPTTAAGKVNHREGFSERESGFHHMSN
jgi:hypothetical protein